MLLVSPQLLVGLVDHLDRHQPGVRPGDPVRELVDDVVDAVPPGRVVAVMSPAVEVVQGGVVLQRRRDEDPGVVEAWVVPYVAPDNVMAGAAPLVLEDVLEALDDRQGDGPLRGVCFPGPLVCRRLTRLGCLGPGGSSIPVPFSTLLQRQRAMVCFFRRRRVRYRVADGW